MSLAVFSHDLSIKLPDTYIVSIKWNKGDSEYTVLRSCTQFQPPVVKYKKEIQNFGNNGYAFLIPEWEVDDFTLNQSSDKNIDISVPTTTSQLTNNSGFITKDVNNLTYYTATSALPTVATTGEYSDLLNPPALKTVATSGSYNDLTDKPALKTVATSGSYNDLIDKPTIIQPVQSNWTEEDSSDLSYVQNKPILIKDIVVTPTTGVITIQLSEPFLFIEHPTATPVIKELIGGAPIAGTWADLAGSNKKEWSFTPTTPDDVLVGTWIITLEIDEG